MIDKIELVEAMLHTLMAHVCEAHKQPHHTSEPPGLDAACQSALFNHQLHEDVWRLFCRDHQVACYSEQRPDKAATTRREALSTSGDCFERGPDVREAMMLLQAGGVGDDVSVCQGEYDDFVSECPGMSRRGDCVVHVSDFQSSHAKAVGDHVSVCQGEYAVVDSKGPGRLHQEDCASHVPDSYSKSVQAGEAGDHVSVYQGGHLEQVSEFLECSGEPRQRDCDVHVSDSLPMSLQVEGVLRHVSVCQEGRADNHFPVSRSKPMHGEVVDDHVSVIQRGCADHDSECYLESVLYPESYPYFPVRSSLPECLAHGAIRQVSEAHEGEKASSAPEAAFLSTPKESAEITTNNVKEEDAKAKKKDEKLAAGAKRFIEGQEGLECANHENDKVARRQKRKEKKEVAAAAREAAQRRKEQRRREEQAEEEKELQRRKEQEDYLRAEKERVNEWEALRHIEGGQELKERYDSYPCMSDKQLEVYDEIMNKLNSLGLVPRATAIYLKLDAISTQIEQSPEETSSATPGACTSKAQAQAQEACTSTAQAQGACTSTTQAQGACTPLAQAQGACTSAAQAQAQRACTSKEQQLHVKEEQRRVNDEEMFPSVPEFPFAPCDNIQRPPGSCADYGSELGHKGLQDELVKSVHPVEKQGSHSKPPKHPGGIDDCVSVSRRRTADHLSECSGISRQRDCADNVSEFDPKEFPDELVKSISPVAKQSPHSKPPKYAGGVGDHQNQQVTNSAHADGDGEDERQQVTRRADADGDGSLVLDGYRDIDAHEEAWRAACGRNRRDNADRRRPEQVYDELPSCLKEGFDELIAELVAEDKAAGRI